MGPPRKCAGKENLDRMNYLCQISNVIATQSPTTYRAAHLYTNLLIAIARKNVQRLDIDLKRQLCKGCRSLLLPGINCMGRVKRKQLRYTCTSCRTVKTFNLKNREYIPWFQCAESVMEILNYKNP